MSRSRCFSLLLLSALLFIDARPASACSCGQTPTVLDAYEHSDFVVITRAISVEKSEKAAPPGQMSDGENYVDGVKSTTMRVEQVYKGNLKVGDELVFAQGGGADCIWTFNEESVGRQYLFYLAAPKQGRSKIWYGFGCGRSAGVKGAIDDLLYLDNLDKVRGKTRISGTLEFSGDDGSVNVEGRKIRLIGANKTYEAKTDENGVYEIYDLPAGKYLIEPETPFGWKVDNFWLGYSPSVAVEGRVDKPLKQIPILLAAGRHASLDLHFEIDNSIRGKIFAPNGKPMAGVCLDAVLPDGSSGGYHADCTDKDGKFVITELPSGSYILAINEDGKIDSSEPFKKFYYPNVTEPEKAAIITVGPGDVRDNINIYVPKVEETITVEGVFLYSDGKPVVDETVEFKTEKSTDGTDGDARAQTDAGGRFSIKILKGSKGKLSGGMSTYEGEFENCPKLEAIIKKSGKDFIDVNTSAVNIEAEKNLYNVELKFPFPGCKKARIN